MRKYFLFDISDRYFNVYFHKERLLFRTLESLYNNEAHQKANNISLFNQLCVPINISFLNSYFKVICLLPSMPTFLRSIAEL